jgi:site-specific DNA-cytosine methylase
MCLNAGGQRRLDAESETLIPTIGGGFDGPVGITLHGTDGTASVASLTELSSSLRARIPSGVENSTTTAVMQPVTYDFFNITAPVNRQSRKPGDPCHTIARSNAEHAVVVQPVHCRDVAQTITSNYGKQVDNSDTALGPNVVAFHPTQDPISSTDVCHAIGTGNGQGCATAAVAVDTYNHTITGDYTGSLTTTGGPPLSGPGVECERLQGFPDNYTAIPWRKKPASECSDGPRYKALGNSWAVPVVRWIGRRIAAATSSHPSSSQTCAGPRSPASR